MPPWLRGAFSTIAHPSEHLGRWTYRVVAILAIALAVVGNVLYIVIADSATWYVGVALVIPAAWLAIERLPADASYDPGGTFPPWAP
jgi:hypothetical protein